jgi:hypothetical protein
MDSTNFQDKRMKYSPFLHFLLEVDGIQRQE